MKTYHELMGCNRLPGVETCGDCNATFIAHGGTCAEPVSAESPNVLRYRCRACAEVAPPKTLKDMSDLEVLEYVAFTLESVAHLQGGLGGLSARMLLAFAERLRMMPPI